MALHDAGCLQAGRLFWLRAHGFWDARLDALGLTPRGRPYEDATRVLALPPAVSDQLAELGTATQREAGYPKAEVTTPRHRDSAPRLTARRLALPCHPVAAAVRGHRARHRGCQVRNLGFRRLAALIHNLVTVAALLGRKPVIPQAPR